MKTKITVKEAARRMGVGAQFVRLGLQQGVLPFGEAVKSSSRKDARYTYHINPSRFEKYLDGGETEGA